MPRKLNHKKILANRAEPTGAAEHTFSEDSGENVIFALRDNYHDFTLGISAVLELLQIAEKLKAVPDLPEEWWQSVAANYRIKYYEQD